MSINDPIIVHGTVSILTIGGNQVGKCVVNGKGFFLSPGRHFINNPQFNYAGSVDRNTECINVKSKVREEEGKKEGKKKERRKKKNNIYIYIYSSSFIFLQHTFSQSIICVIFLFVY